MSFPTDFRYGVATAAYQIEGGAAAGGRGPSIWDTFTHTPGKIENEENGDVACDHYHLWREDVELLSGLGVDSYRLSISWPRIIPEGRGAVNPEGVTFYRGLLKALRHARIRPVVTLYHWDLPQALQDEGGWANRDTAEAFADYAAVVARELGDLVDLWITLNEPWCTAFLGHASGVHAPGHTDPAEALKAAHHLNLAHGLASRAIRAELGQGTPVSIALNIHVTRPEKPDDNAHLDAVRRIDHIGNHIFLGPLLEGSYPTELLRETRDITDWSFVKPGDLTITRQRIDVLGVNYYQPMTVRPASGEGGSYSGGHGEGEASPWVGVDDVEFLQSEGPTTEMGWGIDPDGLYDVLAALDRVYPGTPVMVTENGAAFPDELIRGDHGASVADPRRIDYLKRHFGVVEEARNDGIDVRGFFVWSLLDNFEWADGYRPRFGIVYTDFESLERIPKDSYQWYRDFITRQRTLTAKSVSDAAVALEDRKSRASRRKERDIKAGGRGLWSWRPRGGRR
ncbi:MAG TPA: GH1 family beta-glucosidase [Actinomycetaceae bacterium]|nr:GH1 family beta-glucosidase [Actinomycetaceae bacterium]